MELLAQSETFPDAFPEPPGDLSPEAQALDPAMIWQRLESYMAYRFTERAVTWTVSGPGHFEALLSPATITKAEVWRGDEWEELTLPASPLGGLRFQGEGPYRIAATVGDDDMAVPPAVLEAFRRLAEYMAQDAGIAGAYSHSERLGDASETIRRDASWMGQALQNSGAADLLRHYRKAGNVRLVQTVS